MTYFPSKVKVGKRTFKITLVFETREHSEYGGTVSAHSNRILSFKIRKHSKHASIASAYSDKLSSIKPGQNLTGGDPKEGDEASVTTGSLASPPSLARFW